MTVEVKINVPKESKEVLDTAIDFIEDVIAKKDVSTIAAENLPNLLKAFDGYEKIGGELSSEQRSDLAGYVVKRVLDLLVPVKSEEPAE